MDKNENNNKKKKKFDASQIVRKADDTTLDINKKYLRWLCEKGIETLIIPVIKNEENFEELLEEYRDRYEYELEVIEAMGYVDYFLIVQDYVNYAKNNGIPTGPGRGCLTGEAEVYTTKGMKKLQEINVGDYVFDECGKQCTVLKKFVYEIEEPLIDLVTELDTISLTLDHKVPAIIDGKTKWIASSELTEGSLLVAITDKVVSSTKVISVSQRAFKGTVFDLMVNTQNEPSYATAACIVHNSAAGSLVSYLTGITSVDPIPYGLYFERFLNPGRKGMPDIDIDFPQSKRQEIIDHIRNLYGGEKVAQVATFSYMAARGSIRDSARILGFPAEFGDRISKLISDKPKAKIEEDLEPGKDLYNLYHQNPDVKKVVDTAKSIEGLIRQGSIHASALVIAPLDITDKMPLQTPKKSQMAKTEDGGTDLSSVLVQFDGPTVENLGYLKMDILGLGTLDVIENTLNFIKRTQGKHLTLLDIPFNDQKTYDLLSRGDTNGVFQVESSGMKDVLRMIKPQKFEEIGDIIALYRPGPMEYIPAYKEGKDNPDKIKYLVPELKPILEDTYGIACYQEQLMEIAKEIGGFTLAEADDLRKAISKKNADLLEKLHEKFIDGCVARGISEKKIIELWHLMEAASGYSFNKSHAFSYAVLTYQTAYLKANYPVEFMASLMTYKKDDHDSLHEYINDCKRMNVKVLPPHINYSSIDFDITPSGDISFGLSALKGIGVGPAYDIINSRETNGEYRDLNDFLTRVKVNSRVYEILAKSSALDELGWTKKALVLEKDRVIDFIKKINKKVDTGFQMGFDFMDELDTATIYPNIKDEYDEDVLLEFEHEMLGMYLTGHPIEFYQIGRRLKTKGLPQKQVYNISQLPNLKHEDDVYTFGLISRIHRFESKKGWMAFVTIADFGLGDNSLSGLDPQLFEFDMVLFTDAYNNWGHKMRENDFIFVQGIMNERKDTGSLSLIANNISFLGKDKELDYENDSIMRKIVMDVMHEMKMEQNGLLPATAQEKAAESERIVFSVCEDNSIPLLKVIKKNQGDIPFEIELDGELVEINDVPGFPKGINLTDSFKKKLAFLGVDISFKK